MKEGQDGTFDEQEWTTGADGKQGHLSNRHLFVYSMSLFFRPLPKMPEIPSTLDNGTGGWRHERCVG
jgi:hypothetical protein